LNYYDVLGVNKNASPNEIKNAFRKLVLQFHPDKNKSPDAEKRIMEIYDANRILSDVILRKHYNDTHFEDGKFKESWDDIKTEEYEHATYYEEDVEEEDVEILQVDEIRKEVHRHLDELLEIITFYCIKFSKLNNIKNLIEFKDIIDQYHMFLIFAKSDHYANLNIFSNHNRIFVENIEYRSPISRPRQPDEHDMHRELKHYRQNTYNAIWEYCKNFKFKKTKRKTYTKWKSDKNNPHNNYDDIISHAKKFRNDVIVLAENSVIQRNKSSKIIAQEKTNDKSYTSFGWAAGGIYDDISTADHIDSNPYTGRKFIPPEQELYQKLSLELLLHVNSFSRAVYGRCVAIENQLNEFTEKS
jgi:curved DNA-binding protein CbpA